MKEDDFLLPEGLTKNEIKENSRRHKCLHCGNAGCSDLIASYTNREDDEVVTSWITWNIYFCPECNEINLEQISMCSESGYNDSHGEWILNEEIEFLYPLCANNKYIEMTRTLPNEMIDDYEEAKNVAGISPRSAAALLRLLLEKLCWKYLSKNNVIKKKSSLHDMIGLLVKEHIPDSIQKACDILRITGNETVHSGTIDIRENPQSVELLFELVNMVSDYLHMNYKKIDEVYSTLPTDKVKGIENRDNKGVK